MALSQPYKTVDQYSMDSEALVIVNMMGRLLDRLVGVYEQAGVPLPARRYWMFGPEVPEDCEQAVVTFVQSYLGIPGDQAAAPQQCHAPRTAVINIVITRNFPIGEAAAAVSPERIIEASKWAAVDNAVLTWALSDLTAIDGIPGPGVIATVNNPPPNGGVQSTVLNLSLMIS